MKATESRDLEQKRHIETLEAIRKSNQIIKREKPLHIKINCIICNKFSYKLSNFNLI